MLNKMKYFIVGLAMGITITGGIVFAEESYYKLTKMDCNIIANGKVVNMDFPILNHEGRSYLPLRNIADLTNSSIKWDAETKTINLNNVMKVEYKEVVKEIPKEVIKEVIKEIPKEVIKEVPKVLPIENIKYANGDTYNGSMSNGELDGYGKYSWSNGDCYIGEWVKGYRTGKGIYYYSNGGISAGEWKSGQLTIGLQKTISETMDIISENNNGLITGIVIGKDGTFNYSILKHDLKSNTGISYKVFNNQSISYFDTSNGNLNSRIDFLPNLSNNNINVSTPVTSSTSPITSDDVYNSELNFLNSKLQSAITSINNSYRDMINKFRQEMGAKGRLYSSYTDSEVARMEKDNEDAIKLLNAAYESDLARLKLKYGK